MTLSDFSTFSFVIGGLEGADPVRHLMELIMAKTISVVESNDDDEVKLKSV